MKTITKQPALPVILVIKVGNKYKVDWDNQGTPESKILHTNETFLRGYIWGALAALEIPSANISCAAGTTGTVNKLDESTANKLATLLKNLLHPMVAEEHKRLTNEFNLPHVKFMREREEAKETEVTDTHPITVEI